ncbi:P1 family peptidase [Pseudonocardia eucalypti]|uniref:P1 family peptidase n=1 Tax=Pseudonocardia eucalypti TaxID=648755 RepID=A0ABP9QBG2_9PSEU|nr:L-aminopeptidase/D-esterase-like protein [Pseudonocardia eucalypti]
MKPRARELGIRFDGEPGRHNALTDVPGVRIGYTTLSDGEVRTGVTAILPRGREDIEQPCAAGWFSLNGNGEMTGTAWVEETGALTLPVLITNTHAVGTCHRAVVDWVAAHRPELARRWLLPVVAETFDGYLNDINSAAVRAEHAHHAIDTAAGGPVAEGSVGGGTGMTCYAFKGGSGTASRRVRYGDDTFTVGAFVQANFGSRRELSIAGVPLGRHLADDNPQEAGHMPPGAGSVIAVVGTDAPLLPGQCKALARRVPFGLARTGTTGSHFSGDLFLAFSTANPGALTSAWPSESARTQAYESLRFVPWPNLDPFHAAVAEAVEEAVVNVLVAGETMVGRAGHRSPAMPVDRVLALLRDPAPAAM